MTAYIDLACWPRKEQFEFYRSLDRPQYSVCVQLDVTHFHARVKKRGISFSHTFGFFVTHAANEVPELRMRIKGGQVVLYDELHPSFTEPRAGGALHKYVSVPLCGVLDVFLQRTSEAIARQGERFFLPDEEARDDCLYLSAIPWLCFTGLTHAENLDRDDAIPRISWGRWFGLGIACCCRFPCRRTTRLSTACISGSLLTRCKKSWMLFNRRFALQGGRFGWRV